MADETGTGRQWIVEPPEPGEITLYLAGAADVELTAEQEAALGALLRSLEKDDAEVVGHSPQCTQLSTCMDLSCTKMSCWPLQCLPLRKKAADVTGAAGGWNLMGSFAPPSA